MVSRRGSSSAVSQAQGGLGGDAPLAEHDLVDAPRVHAEGEPEPVLAEAERPQELLEQHLPRVHRGEPLFGHRHPFQW